MADLSLTLVPQTPADQMAIERLDERAFGPGRFARSAYRLREGVEPDYALSFVARVGPPARRRQSHDADPLRQRARSPGPAARPFDASIRRFVRAASAKRWSCSRWRPRVPPGTSLVLLVGDEPYYGRMGFAPVPKGRLAFCGPVDPERLLYCELVEGAFAEVGGRVMKAA